MAAVSGRRLGDIRLEVMTLVVPAPAASEFESKLNEALNPKPYVPQAREIKSIELPGTSAFTGITTKRIYEYARSRGLSELELRFYQLRGALKLRNHVGPYLVFPVFFDSVPVSYQGRCIVDRDPKYVSDDDVADWLWPLLPVNLQHLKKKREAVLVEGVFDAASCWRIGRPGLCTFGKKISNNQISLLRDLGVTQITLAWDANALDDIERAALRLGTTFDVRIADLSVLPATGQVVDPGDVLCDLALESWLLERLEKTISYGTSEFFDWRLALALT
jgi:hypothetical protein